MKLVINIVIGLLLASAIFFGAQYFLGGEPEPTAGLQVTTTPGSTVRPAGAAARVSNEDFLALLRTADSISFKSQIFDDPVFLQLEDFHEPLPDREVGRLNPFANVGIEAAVTPGSATSTKPKSSGR